MRLRRYLGYVAALMLVALSSDVVSSYGQSEQPKNFYEKHYADAPRVQGEVARAPEVARPSSGQGSPSGRQGAASGVSTSGTPVAQGSPGAVQQGPPRMRVTLYVASHNRAHFETVVDKALQLKGSNPNVWVQVIFHIGDYRNVSPELVQRAQSSGVGIYPLKKVPSFLSVKDSPTWVLRTGEEEHVVEGIIPIEKCIGPNGEYREPERSMFQAPPTPTVGVKGF